MVQEFSDWLASTALSQTFADLGWFVPTVQTIHILSIAVVVITLAMLDVRLLVGKGTGKGATLSELAQSYLPWVWKALWVLLATGTLLTITEPGRELMNLTFRLKMLMVAILVILTLVFQGPLRREPGYWDATEIRRWLGSALGLVSLLLCVFIVVAGRLIAYT
jgi:hypothetical protein